MVEAAIEERGGRQQMMDLATINEFTPGAQSDRCGSSRACDPESLDKRLKSLPLHPKPRGSAARAAEDPVRLLEDAHDVGPLDRLERRRAFVPRQRGRQAAAKVFERDGQRRAGRENDRSLDQVL